MREKTIKSLVLLFAAALFVFGGCEKREWAYSEYSKSSTITDNSDQHIDILSKSGCKIVDDDNIEKLIQNKIDINDELINRQLLRIAKSFMNRSNNTPNVLKEIYLLIENSAHNTITYETIFELDNDYKKIHHQKEYYGFADLKDSLVYKNKSYNVSIFCPNPTKLRSGVSPIIGVGTDIVSDSDDTDDYIPVWIPINGIQTSALINEQFVLESDLPVLIFTLSSDETISISSDKINDSEFQKSTNLFDVKMTHCAISERYENDNKSEYAFSFKIQIDNYISDEIINDTYIKIHKDNLNKTISVNMRLYPYQTFVPDRIYGVTYERDWYARGYNITIGDNPQYAIYCQMKYAHEWYQKVDFLDINNGSFKFILSKGMVRFAWPL